MVLQDISDGSPSSDGFDDTPYPSDSDPYSPSAASSSSSRRFDPDLCAQPIPILGPLIGFPQSVLRYRTEATISFAEKKIGRPVTQEEAQALAGHLYQMESTGSYFTAVGVGLGAFRCYSTAATNRYPFYLPKAEKIDPNKFLFVKGPLARYSRHSARAFCYLFIAGEMGRLVGRIVAQPTAAKATAEDPRMTKFTEDLKKATTAETSQSHWDVGKARAAAAAEAREAQRRRHGEQPPNGEANTGPSRDSWPQRRVAPPPNQDDMSPIAGNDWSSTSDINTGFSSDTMQESAPKQKPYQRTRTASSWRGQPSSTDNDDASPTGGLFEDEVQSQSKPGESSWDRLRRGGGPAPSQQPPPRRPEPQRREPKGDVSSSDSFPFADSSEDRSTAQAKAQQEFDARMQHEREGKDFNEERRW